MPMKLSSPGQIGPRLPTGRPQRPYALRLASFGIAAAGPAVTIGR